MRRFRSRGRSFRRSRPPMHWVNSQVWGVETALGAAGTTTTTGLCSSTAQAGVGFIDNNVATVYRIVGDILYRQTSGNSAALVIAGIIEVPATAGGALDAADFSPEVVNNVTKPWLWMGSGYAMANNAAVNQDAICHFHVDIRVRRKLSESGIVLVTRHIQVIGAASAVNYVPNVRVLVGRLG